jgi:acyl carrier protein phosphodiesterase
MNFLAHALLAGDSPALVVGGVVGDWIKGPLPGALPDDLARGVALHRAIDTFAETHPAFCLSRARMSPARRRYAGVLVDIFWDHLLARSSSPAPPRHTAPSRAPADGPRRCRPAPRRSACARATSAPG